MTAQEKILKGLKITSRHKILKINNLLENPSKKGMIRVFQSKIWSKIHHHNFHSAVQVKEVFIRYYHLNMVNMANKKNKFPEH